MDYDFKKLDLDDDGDAAIALRRGWLSAVRETFREGRPDEAFHDHWLRRAREDDLACTGAWRPEGEFGAGPKPVATYASFDKDLNVGLEQLPTRLVTDVTTSPAHIRQGLLRRLITDDLADAAAKGLPLAALTAAEATIYGRFGFGVATLRRSVEVLGGHRFALRDFTDPGRVELIEPKDAWPLLTGVYDRFRATTRGALGWPAFYEDMHTGAYDYTSGPDAKLQAAVHLDAAGAPDGFVLFRYSGDEDAGTIKVHEWATLTPEAALAQWRMLASMDRVAKVEHGIAQPDDPLPWALVDTNAWKVTGEQEFLWLRVLDVRRTFEARPWSADGRVVVEVDDPLGHAAGRWSITTSDGRALVEQTEAEADVRMDAETLATHVLATASVALLHAAGRVTGSPEAIAEWADMADLAGAPYCLTGF